MQKRESRHLRELKKRVFKTILFISSISFFLISFLNLFNKRPIANFIYPFLGSILVLIMHVIYKKDKYNNQIRIIYLIFLCILYLPSAWLTSPGSYSAMSFYTVLILFISIILIDNNWEYIFPIMVIIETVILLNYEPYAQDRFTLYTEPRVRAFDLSFNYIIVAIIMLLIIHVINSYFDKEHRRIFYTAVTDQLTNLYNRRYIQDYLKSFYNSKGENIDNFSILMIDLNNFKKVNDNYGHNEGDRVLKEFARVLKSASRREDVIARYGGDEFLLVLPKENKDSSFLVRDRIIDNFMPLYKKYKDINLEVGIGIAESGNYTIDEIIKIADDELYKDKIYKKNAARDNN